MKSEGRISGNDNSALDAIGAIILVLLFTDEGNECPESLEGSCTASVLVGVQGDLNLRRCL